MTSHCLHYYVGTYTDSPSTSTGIARITLNPDSGELTRLEDVTALRNPSYLTVTQVGLYSVSEVSRDEGALVQFTSPLSSRQLAIAGDSPCHLAIKPLTLPLPIMARETPVFFCWMKKVSRNALCLSYTLLGGVLTQIANDHRTRIKSAFSLTRTNWPSLILEQIRSISMTTVLMRQGINSH